MNTPLYFRIILLLCLIYPLILPLHFFEPIERNIGYSFFCLIYINKHAIFDEWSIFFNIFYNWGVISPCAIVVSGFKFKGSFVFIFNFIFLYIAFICICAINFRWAGESVRLLLLFFHPCYIIIPIILNILIYITYCRYSDLNKRQEKNKIDNFHIQTNTNNNSKDTSSIKATM